MENDDLMKTIQGMSEEQTQEFIKMLEQDSQARTKLQHIVKETRKDNPFFISNFRTETPMLDKYADIVERILIETKASLRSGDKAMMTPRTSGEGHITSRGKHQDQVMYIMADMAKQLGLNVELARLIGNHHDDGHTFNGHIGEAIMSSIGQLLDCGYTVHNALSVEMLIEENILERIEAAIKIQNPDITSDEIEMLNNEMYDVYDGILSHNGEGTDSIIRPKNKSIERIREEINGCSTIEKYDKGIVPRTMEGALIRFADIIAYTRSDTLDGFQLGIISGFDVNSLKDAQAKQNEPIREDEYYTDYLKIIGVLSQYNDKTENSLINVSNRVTERLNNLKRKDSEMKASIKSLEREIMDLENSIYDDSTQYQINEMEMEKKKIQDKQISMQTELQTATDDKNKSDQEKIEAGKKYISQVGGNKYLITDMIQQVFIKDLIETSKDKDYIGFSPSVTEALFNLRNCNMKYIVKYIRRPFETEKLPTATLELVKKMAKTLRESGFIDNNILPESEKTLQTTEGQEQFSAKMSNGEYSEYEKKLLKRFNTIYKNNPERISVICSNAMDSIPNILKNDLKIALGEKEYTGSLPKQYEEKMKRMRSVIKQRYPGITEVKKTDCPVYIITEEQQSQLLNELKNDRRKDMRDVFSYALAKEYVEGLSDSAIIDALLQAGIISEKDLADSRKRSFGKGGDKNAERLEKEWHDAQQQH